MNQKRTKSLSSRSLLLCILLAFALIAATALMRFAPEIAFSDTGEAPVTETITAPDPDYVFTISEDFSYVGTTLTPGFTATGYASDTPATAINIPKTNNLQSTIDAIEVLIHGAGLDTNLDSVKKLVFGDWGTVSDADASTILLGANGITLAYGTYIFSGKLSSSVATSDTFAVTGTISLIGNANFYIADGVLENTGTATNSRALYSVSTGEIFLLGGTISAPSSNGRAIMISAIGSTTAEAATDVYKRELVVTAGNVVSGSAVAIQFRTNGLLTVSGTAYITAAGSSSSEGTVTFSMHERSTTYTEPSIIVNGGKIENSGTSPAINNISKGSIVINNGLIERTGAGGTNPLINITNGASSSGGAHTSGGLIVNGGTIRGIVNATTTSTNANALIANLFTINLTTVKTGNIIVTGGTIENLGTGHAIKHGTGNLGDSGTPGAVNISGGTISNASATHATILVNNNNNPRITISGGTIKNIGNTDGVYSALELSTNGGFDIKGGEILSLYEGTEPLAPNATFRSALYVSGYGANSVICEEDKGTPTIIKSQAPQSTFPITTTAGTNTSNHGAVTYIGTTANTSLTIKGGLIENISDTGHALFYANGAGTTAAAPTRLLNIEGGTIKAQGGSAIIQFAHTDFFNRLTISEIDGTNNPTLITSASEAGTVRILKSLAATQSAAGTGGSELVFNGGTIENRLHAIDSGAVTLISKEENLTEVTPAISNNLSIKIGSKVIPGSVTVDVGDASHTGSAVTPLTYNIPPLVADEDYTVAYADNTEVGIASSTLTLDKDEAGSEGVFKVYFELGGSDIDASITMEGWTYFDEPKNPVVTSTSHNAATAIIQYKLKSARDDAYSATKPTDAGVYTVRAIFAATPTLPSIIRTADYTVAKHDGTGSTVTVRNYIAGTTTSGIITPIYSPAAGRGVGTGNTNLNVNWQHATAPTDDSAPNFSPKARTIDESRPTAPGKYIMRVTFLDVSGPLDKLVPLPNFEEFYVDATYYILAKTPNTEDVSVSQANSPTTIPLSEPEYEIKTAGYVFDRYEYYSTNSDSPSLTPPSASSVAIHSIRALFTHPTLGAIYAESQYERTMNEFECIVNVPIFTQSSAANVTFTNIKGSRSTAHSTSNVTTFQIKPFGSADSQYGDPVNHTTNSTRDAFNSLTPGKYTIKFVFEQTSIYLAFETTADFTVYTAGAGTVTMESWLDTAAAAKNPVATSAITGYADSAVFHYKVRGASDDTYTLEKPEAIGLYTVRATFAATETHTATTATADFAISKDPATKTNLGSGTLSITGWTRGYFDAAVNSPVVAGVTLEQGAPVYQYSTDNTFATFTTTRPDRAGDYYIRAVFETADNIFITAAVPFTIAVNPPSGVVDIDDWAYGETAEDPYVTGEQDLQDAPVYQYSLTNTVNDGSAELLSGKPSNAGTYYIRAFFAANDYFDDYWTPWVAFTIDKGTVAAGTVTITMADFTFGTTASTPQITDTVPSEFAAPLIEYKLTSGGTYSTTVPTARGAYTVRATYTATDNYNGFSITAAFEITNPTHQGTVTMADWVYGSANNPVITSTTFNVATDFSLLTITYKLKSAEDIAANWSATKPSNVGIYIIKVLFPADSQYAAFTVTDEFEITKAPSSALAGTVSITGWTFGGTANSPSVTGAKTWQAAPTFEYRLASLTDGDYSSTVPTNAGSYLVRAVYAATTNYDAFTTAAASFTIAKATVTATITMTMANFTFGTTASTPQITGTVPSEFAAPTYEYKLTSAADSAYSTTVPTARGAYTVRATYAATANYNAFSITATFTIVNPDGTGTVAMTGWTFGQTASDPIPTSATNTAVTYMYKVKDAADTTYTAVKPTNAGSYTVKASFEATADYNAFTTTADFVIAKADGTASVTMDSWTPGETASNPVPVSATNGITTVLYEYKLQTAADSTYSETKPSAIGNYTVRATFAATSNYNSVIATANFAILAMAGEGSVTMANWTFGAAASNPVPVSATNGIANVTYTYKVQGAEDSTYTATKPTNAGSYTVKATFVASGNYLSVTTTANFTILKASGSGAIVTITGWASGETANTPAVTGQPAEYGTPVFEYKVKDADDSTYSTVAPTDAGDYTVRAKFAATTNYNEYVTEGVDFSIAKKGCGACGTITASDSGLGGIIMVALIMLSVSFMILFVSRKKRNSI